LFEGRLCFSTVVKYIAVKSDDGGAAIRIHYLEI